MSQIKFTLDYKKSTKNTYVYGEQDTASPVAALYIKRSAMPDGYPEKITVVVESAGND